MELVNPNPLTTSTPKDTTKLAAVLGGLKGNPRIPFATQDPVQPVGFHAACLWILCWVKRGSGCREIRLVLGFYYACCPAVEVKLLREIKALHSPGDPPVRVLENGSPHDLNNSY